MEPTKLNCEIKPKLWGSERWVQTPGAPILVKLIDAKDDLSVQVHPDDSYAQSHEKESNGKAECWYILDAKPGASIVLGHNAVSREQLADMILKGAWDALLRVVPVHKGDMFMIPPGTLHAIRAGVKLLEVQQNSDITYRVYDYNRLENGKPRELHMDKALDVVTAPFETANANPVLRSTANPEFIQLCTCEYFTVWKLSVHASAHLVQDREFMIVSVIDGAGKINESTTTAGDHFLLPRDFGAAQITGNLTLIISAA